MCIITYMHTHLCAPRSPRRQRMPMGCPPVPVRRNLPALGDTCASTDRKSALLIPHTIRRCSAVFPNTCFLSEAPVQRHFSPRGNTCAIPYRPSGLLMHTTAYSTAGHGIQRPHIDAMPSLHTYGAYTPPPTHTPSHAHAHTHTQSHTHTRTHAHTHTHTRLCTPQISSVHTTPNDSVLLCASRDNTVALWDFRTQTTQRVLRAPNFTVGG